MTAPTADPSPPPASLAPPSPESAKPARRRHPILRFLAFALLGLIVLAVIGRLMMPSFVRSYVNRTLAQDPNFQGQIGDVSIHLWRGAYTIENVKIIKLAGEVPVPLFACDRLDLAVEWDALLHGKIVGRVRMDKPEVNFVDGKPGDTKDDGGKSSSDQTGSGGPWLQMLAQLFPFQINSAHLVDGSVHFRTYQGKVPVDVYLNQLDAHVENLTNVLDETTPLVTTIRADALAMNQAPLKLNINLDPFSYRPTFHMTFLLLGLDVTKINELTRLYGNFDFEHGWFDLVIDLDSKEGALYGYIKPLFRNLKIFTAQDLKEDNVFQAFWEALVGGVELVLQNQQRDQFGTVIPVTGDANSPSPNILDTIGNVLKNAFVRAYLPRLENPGKIDDSTLLFGKPSLSLTPIEVDKDGKVKSPFETSDGTPATTDDKPKAAAEK